MGKNEVLVPIPDGARRRYSGSGAGQVYVVTSSQYNPLTRHMNEKRVYIGRYVDDQHMLPNANYRLLYPKDYANACGGDQAVSNTRKVGVYAMALSVAQRNTLYPLLVKWLGPIRANFYMDFAQYEIASHSNVAELFSSTMSDHVMFSDRAYSDSWISETFSDESLVARVNGLWDDWVRHCIDKGIVEVWISVDGSNNDCEADIDEAEEGHAKSKKNVDIIGYMTAVDPKTGTVVAYKLYRGGRVDCKEVLEIVTYLDAFAIKILGFIFDRGFCTEDTERMIRSMGYSFVMMLKENTTGFDAVYQKHAEDIRLKVQYALPSSTDGTMFGITDMANVFKNSPQESNIGLFYDAKNGPARACYLIQKIREIEKTARSEIEAGNVPSIPKQYRGILTVTVDGEKIEIVKNMDEFQRQVDQKGYSAIASNDEKLTADQINSTYHSRDASEKGFRQFKTDLGNDTMYVHSLPSQQNKFAVGFVAAIIRTEFENACKALNYATNLAVKELEQLVISYLPNGTVKYIHTENQRQILLLRELGVDIRNLEELAEQQYARDAGTVTNPVRSMSVFTNPDSYSGKKRGRKPGSKNRPKESSTSADKDESTPKRGRGRPKGSKNKKTLEREAAEAQHPTAQQKADTGNETPAKRGRGRPKGSKNKKTLEREAAEAQHPTAQQEAGTGNEPPAKRGRGRPKGSKSKKTLERKAAEAQRAAAQQKADTGDETLTKRGRGRPKGSKNKKTLEREAATSDVNPSSSVISQDD